MESKSWKNLLLKWIQSTKCLIRLPDELDLTNLQTFYEEFKKKFTAKAIIENDVFEFLNVHYPTFEIDYDDSNQISTIDYIYIYSLFLHFSCVKYPEPYYQQQCNTLSNKNQQSIAAFFRYLLNQEYIDRDILTTAISNTVPSSHLHPIDFASLHSPNRTQQIQITPPTPKTSLLENNSRELIHLRASLESEIYERGCLDMLLKQSEEKNEKLVNAQKHYLEEIHQLRNDLLMKDSENISPNKNLKNNQIKNRLLKQISEKDEQIFELKSNIITLNDDNRILKEKLMLSKKEMASWIEKASNLENMIDNIKADMEKKNEIISALEETRSELQHFIRETRAKNQSDSLDSSEDCIDISFSRVRNSSQNILASPENLAHSVVDVQLKEKETENITLKGEISLLKTEQDILSENINKILNSYSPILNIDNSQVNCNTIKNFEIFFNHFTIFVTNYENLQKMAEELSLEKNNQMIEFDTEISGLKQNIKHFQNENNNLNDEVNRLQSYNSELTVEAEKIKLQIEKIQKEMVEKSVTLKEIKDDYNNLKQTEQKLLKVQEKDKDEKILLISKIKELEIQNNDLIESIKEYESKNIELQNTKDLNEKLNAELVKLSSDFDNTKSLLEAETNKLTLECNRRADLQSKINDIEIKHRTAIESLEIYTNENKRSYQTLLSQYDEITKIKSDFECQNQKISSENETLKKELNSINENCETLKVIQKDLINREAKLLELQEKEKNEKDQLNLKILQLEAKIELTETKYRDAAENLEIYTNKYNENEKSNQILLSQFEEIKNKNETLKKQLNSINENCESLKVIQKDLINREEKLLKLQEKEKNEKDHLNLKILELESMIELMETKYRDATENLEIYIKKINENEKSNEILLSQFEDMKKIKIEIENEKNLLSSENEMLKNDNKIVKENCDGLKVIKEDLINRENKLLELQEKEKNEKDNLNLRILELQSKIELVEAKYRDATENLEVHIKKIHENEKSKQILLSQFEEMTKIKIEFENEKNLLSNENKTLKNEIKSINENCESLKVIQKDFINREHNLLELLEKQNNEKLLSTSKISELETAIEVMETNYRNAAEKLEIYTNKINGNEKSNQILKSQFEEMIKYNTEIDIQNKSLSSENEILKNEIKIIKENFESIKLKQVDFINKEQNLIKLLEKEKNEKTLLTLKISELEATIELTETKYHHAAENLEFYTNKINKNEKSNKILSEELDEMTKIKAEIENQNKLTSSESEALKNEITSLREDYNNIKLKEINLLELQEKEKEEKVILISRISELESKIIELFQRNNTLESNEATLKIDFENTKTMLDSEREKYQLQCNDYTNQILENKKSHQILLLQYDEITKIKTEIEYQNKVLSSENEILKNEIKIVKENCESLKENEKVQKKNELELKESAHKIELQSKKDLIENLKAEINTISNDFKNKKTSFDALTEKYQLECDMHLDLQSKTNDIESKYLRATETLEIYSKKINEKEQSYQILLSQFDELTKIKANIENQNNLLSSENESLKNENKNYKEQIYENELRKLKMIEADNKAKEYERKFIELHKKYLELQNEFDSMKSGDSLKSFKLNCNETKLKQQIKDIQILYEAEIEKNNRCVKDLEIFEAKLIKTRQIKTEQESEWKVEKEKLISQITEEKQNADARIKENRFEMNGKLDKMKEKMKNLYTDEVEKSKIKYQVDLTKLQSDYDTKIQRYKEHIDVLSKQMYLLNDKNLELHKENEMLRTRRHLMESTNSLAIRNHVQQSGSTANMIGTTNLKMDDEEGEVFNNTYLTDLKGGINLGMDSVCGAELQYRNSLAPPHLRSTYVAQYGDQDVREDDIKGPLSFDDSLNSILYSGQRKKITGATTYKRPGPPTPSKNAGRLSFGGGAATIDFHPRDILKESNQNLANAGTSKKNTPGKIMSFFSSSKGNRDEYTDWLTINRNHKIKNSYAITSTPHRNIMLRKKDYKKNTAPIKLSDKCDDFNWREPIRYLTSESGTTTSGTPDTSNFNRQSIKSSRKSITYKIRNRRSSIYIKQSKIFGKSTKDRETHRNLSRLRRIENFNSSRASLNKVQFQKSAFTTVDDDFKENDTLINDLSDNDIIIINNNSYEDEFEKLVQTKISKSPFEIDRINNKRLTLRNRKNKYSNLPIVINNKIPKISIKPSGGLLQTDKSSTLIEFNEQSSFFKQYSYQSKLIFIKKSRSLILLTLSFIVIFILYKNFRV